jgi:hypothetical protein
MVKIRKGPWQLTLPEARRVFVLTLQDYYSIY